MQHWIDKFRCAFRGLWIGAYRQSSFVVHYTICAIVCGLAILLRCEAWQWCAMLLCMAVVLGLEYVNSAIERLAKGLCTNHNEDVGAALDVAAAAVLVASGISVVIGVLIFSLQIWKLLT